MDEIANRTVCRQKLISFLTLLVGAYLQLVRGLLIMAHCPLCYSVLILYINRIWLSSVPFMQITPVNCNMTLLAHVI